MNELKAKLLKKIRKEKGLCPHCPEFGGENPKKKVIKNWKQSRKQQFRRR
jgi:hypothetical protein